MATLAGQRAQFTWALNQYNIAESPEDRAKFARRMARYIAAAPVNGFTVEQLTQNKIYPSDEVACYLNDPEGVGEPDISEEQALRMVEMTVDTRSVAKVGEGPMVVYAYGYRCAPDRLKIGSTEGDVTQRIAAQINASTPDRPVLYLEIRTTRCRSLERAIHNILEIRGQKVDGGGSEWFNVDIDQIISIYNFIVENIDTNNIEPVAS